MKQEISFDDGDLEFISGKVKEVMNLVDSLRLSLEKLLSISFTITVKVLGFKIIEVQADVKE